MTSDELRGFVHLVKAFSSGFGSDELVFYFGSLEDAISPSKVVLFANLVWANLLLAYSLLFFSRLFDFIFSTLFLHLIFKILFLLIF